MEIVVFGAGSLGSLLGGLLAREHEVTLVGRNPHVEAIREDGLEISGRLEANVRPKACLEPPESATLAIVCVKAFDTEAAAAELADCDLDAVLSVQNGMGNETVLADRLEASVLAGTCTYGAVKKTPGAVRCTGIGEIALGPPEGGSSRVTDRVGAALETAGLLTTVETDMPRRLWQKLAVNAGINATSALADIPNGATVEGETRPVAVAAARETAAVARREGVELDGETARRALDAVAEATAENVSSMRQDVAAGRRTEIDAINGYVLVRAEEHGLDVPRNRTLTRLIRAWETERGLR